MEVGSDRGSQRLVHVERTQHARVELPSHAGGGGVAGTRIVS